MKIKAVSGIMLGLFLLSTLTVAFNIKPAEAQTRKVGVKVGDWSKYEVAYNYTTNDPIPLFGFRPESADIEYFKTEVLSVTGMNITFQTTTHFKNGTEVCKVMWMDISSGSIGGPPPWIIFVQEIPFIVANLTAGDTLTPDPSSYVINATLMRTYASAKREVNFVRLRHTIGIIRLKPRAEFLIDTTTYMFWDKATGVLVEANKTTSVTNISEGYLTKIFNQLIMKETNIWGSTFIPAEVCVNPKSLNLRSQGKWITTYIELPEDYKVSDIDVSTVMLNGTIPVSLLDVPAPEPVPTEIGDYDNDGVQDLMVKFNRTELTSHIYNVLGIEYGNVTLTITGEVAGTPFEGSDSIRVVFPSTGSRGHKR